jgi:hypothetical protein
MERTCGRRLCSEMVPITDFSDVCCTQESETAMVTSSVHASVSRCVSVRSLTASVRRVRFYSTAVLDGTPMSALRTASVDERAPVPVIVVQSLGTRKAVGRVTAVGTEHSLGHLIQSRQHSVNAWREVFV